MARSARPARVHAGHAGHAFTPGTMIWLPVRRVGGADDTLPFG